MVNYYIDDGQEWYSVWEQLKKHNEEFAKGPYTGQEFAKGPYTGQEFAKGPYTGQESALNEIKRLQDSDSKLKFQGVEERSNAWVAVWDQLFQHNPNLYLNGGSCGRENALIEIKKLQKKNHKILDLESSLAEIRRNDELMSRGTLEQLQKMEKVVAELLKD